MVQNKKRILSLILMLTLLVSSLVIGAITASAAEETTISFASTAQRVSQTSTAQVWKNGDVTFTNNKASSSSAVANYSKPVRLYAGSNVVVECSKGNITKIEFDCNSSSYATAMKNSIGSAATASSDKVTVTLDGTSNTFTVAKLTAQVRLDSMTVTYKATSTEPDAPTCEHTYKDATCTAPKTCDKCGSTDGNALGHDLVTVNGKDATCTEDGYTEYKDCSRCDYIEGKKTIPASHNYVDGVCSCGEKQPLEATITFDENKTHRTEYSSSIQVWEKDGLSLTNNKGASTSNVADYSDPARFYKSSQVVISFPHMTTLVIDASGIGNDYLWDATLKAAGLNFTVEDKVYTITFASPVDSITLTCSNQVRANSITATVKKICEHENVGDDYICDNEDCKEIIAPEDGSTLTIEQAIKLGEAFKDRTDVTHTTNTYLVVGTIIDKNPTDKYGNCTIKSGDYAIYIRLLRNSDGEDYGEVDVKPVLGDTITVIAQIGYYNKPELYEARLIKIDAHDHAYDNGCDIECNVCGDNSREPNHTYDNACDATCNVCSATRTVGDHSYNPVVTAPTFDAQGYTTHTCVNCGNSYVDSYVDALVAVATADGDKYTSLAEALENGSEIVLLADVNLEASIVITSSYTFNLNGHTITAGFSGDVVEVFLVKDGGTLVISGNGKILSTGDGEHVECISVIDGGEVTIENGEFISDGCTAIYATRGGKVVINGGYYEAKELYNGMRFLLDVNEAEEIFGEIVVTGGTFVNFNPANHTNDGKGYTNKVAPGYITTKDNNGNYVVSEFKAPTDPTEKVTISNPFTLAEDVILNGELVIKNGAVIDLNGCTIESSAVITFNGTIVDTVGTGKIIVNVDSETNKPMLQIAKGNYDYAPLHVETVDGKSTYAITPVKVQGVDVELDHTAIVRPSLKGQYTNKELFADNVIAHGITFELLVTRDNGVDDPETATLTFTEKQIHDLFDDNKSAIKLTLVGGLEGYTYTVELVVKSAGVQVHSAEVATLTVPVKSKEEVLPETPNN